jgi:uncharacterized protein YsxB (DUF464 family)
MVKVTFTEVGNLLSLLIEGHAGQADIGKDIVCASCSILAYTVAKIVNDANDHGGLESSPIVNLDSGGALILCDPNKDRYAEIRHAYEVVQEGYALLAENYPQYVEVKQFGKPT